MLIITTEQEYRRAIFPGSRIPGSGKAARLERPVDTATWHKNCNTKKDFEMKVSWQFFAGFITGGLVAVNYCKSSGPSLLMFAIAVVTTYVMHSYIINYHVLPKKNVDFKSERLT